MATFAPRPLRLARGIGVALPAVLLLGALGFEHLGGLPPCEMCVWQRWPLLAALLLAVAAVRAPNGIARVLLVSAGSATVLSGLIGAFHAGVEYGWWDGITACTAGGGPAAGASDADILASIMATPIVRCDVAPWSLLGVSLAGYNALFATLGGLAVTLLAAGSRRVMR